MPSLRHIERATALMEGFAEATGLASPGRHAPRRYLWTDAFGVCNFLALHRHTGVARYGRLAEELITQVHETLGRHRPDDPRAGWISGLPEEEGRQHPTVAGLRIGKKLPERRPGEPFDERLEWERDGQYYHYLTKWMHALHQAALATGKADYLVWACELAAAAHRAFVYQPSPGAPRRMYWKMSVDLTNPLVPSMGHHDPLDGYITFSQLARAAAQWPGGIAAPDLSRERAELAQMCRGRDWTTDDPLGLGGLLFDACRVLQLSALGEGFEDDGLAHALLESAYRGLQIYLSGNSLRLPAEARLAFREFGLSIGLHAVDLMDDLLEASSVAGQAEGVKRLILALGQYLPAAEAIEQFWLETGNRRSRSWTSHEDINTVMLTTSLLPDGFVMLGPAAPAGSGSSPPAGEGSSQGA